MLCLVFTSDRTVRYPIDRLDRATADLDPPLAAVDLAALRANAAELARRAGGKPIRLATKSIRCREVLRTVLAMDGFAGVFAYSLPEALWLAGEISDVVVGYPTVHRAALRVLGGSPELRERVTLVIDSTEQLDAIEPLLGDPQPAVRVCLELDASLRIPPGGLRFGARRSPVRTPAQAAELAEAVRRRPAFRLVGLLCYEAQIAGVGDRGPGVARRALVRTLQRISAAELTGRRAAVVAAVRAVADLEFVNGGGTGSVERTAAEDAVTEIAAGSGLYGPTLFDTYRLWRPRPAAFFALPVVRRPHAGAVTASGGGWVASGPPGPDRLPTPCRPAGLRLSRTEAAGEVQTPLLGAGADALRIGDRVWFRHAKAGELAEHVNELNLVDGDRIATTAPTYRGEGRAFG